VIRAVVDSSVFVSASIGSPSSPPSAVFEAWEDGGFELIVSPKLLGELSGVLRRPKFERYLEARDVDELLAQVEAGATVLDDVDPGGPITRDPDDDYLVALARAAGGVLVSGDRDLLEADVADVEILSPREFLARLEAA
jgi:putative PIN family toxin of toxin-antitoxin system